ncbi:hypothetical protein ANCCAN_09983 [Ancylostoma caninum]|uniref:Uncharacterized protein n=1 Tax=Ancylostoma caninum TaxID=29170 RepID=A0A368GK38_ANCCA|nr:hypothetical protein ANCCAN_09983 [Ancylostoma caninum]
MNVLEETEAKRAIPHYSVQPLLFRAVKKSLDKIHREVNDKPVASKTMLKYYITEGAVKEGRIHFLVECPSGEAYRDSCDMAPDVTEIALKQVEKFKKSLNVTPGKSIYVAGRAKKSVHISTAERTEVGSNLMSGT